MGVGVTIPDVSFQCASSFLFLCGVYDFVPLFSAVSFGFFAHSTVCHGHAIHGYSVMSSFSQSLL